ncbi:1-aminocyclopropane-1-carboxylate deaminase/D-cysteine desulfhydrase [uncultured Microbulbifer sp.]|uniref:1-aminocyclopropane-1-carboxylate deaminase/D-cysteine desulfhydrase n=1 Tax=uncultured Microbulbifer sp. TaxID=348147 RepID=UPI0026067652|nr:pyridoxal-phosphate dependent enzyme [uncultured Microbulbifer sp.]
MIRYLTELSLEHFTEAARNIPYQQIHSDLFPGLNVWIRRDDLIDPLISGNKAYKLIYNLLEARKQGKDTIVTCGGAWSNHIHATAAAGQRFGFKTIGIIRGERPPKLSAMLQDAERFGMVLRFISRKEYRNRHQAEFLEPIGFDPDSSWFVPEGGANSEGGRGVQLLGRIITETAPVIFDECWLPCGTGLTAGALASVLPQTTSVTGVAVVRDEPGIRLEIKKWADQVEDQSKVDLILGGHHGGYGRVSESLRQTMTESERKEKLALDHVYGAKLMSALTHCAAEPFNEENKRQKNILILHTGGVQGKRGLTNN